MSSSQEQSNSSNNDQTQNINPNPPGPSSNILYSDYEVDPPIASNNSSNLNDQSSSMSSGLPNDSTGQIHSNDFMNPLYTDEQYQDDDDIPDELEHELEHELEATVERMTDEELNDNDEDETIYSDAIQNAFVRYENEQDEMFEQMRECMHYMEQEYSTAEMPNNLIESSQQTKLNPEAAEFRPLNSQPSTSTDKERIVVLSWVPCEAKKQDEQKDF
ncbi:unnamed protein product [Rotaria sordida]|uniref:Uncharacterized protein n=1 Tax=Rotaria sordida TaxID=392033 RepID=A0A819I6C5_9BILA|nr:unnamed protein product [Rotaria sordida]CAF1318916.1 unnamed protein product [Rotaria sordida]CAF3911575.1 unnamed protein product [Rotaria sordida]